jgi:thymidylate kinase
MSAIYSAFDALDRAEIPYSFRKATRPWEPLPAGAEVDIMLGGSEVPATERVLREAGFHHLKSSGCRGHRFYVAFEHGQWLKIDAKVGPWIDLPAFLGRWPGVAGRRVLGALALRRPLSPRRLGPVIALLGPDGAGKGTLIACLRERIPVGLTILYLGWRPRSRREAPGDRPGRRVGSLREAAYVLYWAARYWRMLLRGYIAAWAGHIVLCDRHPIETLAIRPRATRLAATLERIVVGRLMPWPDVILLLDASGTTLYARKGEHSPEVLERWRRGYREVFAARGATVISTEEPLESTAAQASAAVWQALKTRRRWRACSRGGALRS